MTHCQCLLMCISVSVASGALADGTTHPTGFDAKAREIYAKVIAIPTQTGTHAVPMMAEYLAQEFLGAGFPAADVTILPLKSQVTARLAEGCPQQVNFAPEGAPLRQCHPSFFAVSEVASATID